MIRIGAQLYTVRKKLTGISETEQTLKEIKDIGYHTVQLFGSLELAETCAECAEKAGLEVVGFLGDLKTCQENKNKLFELCKKYNIPDIGVSNRLEDCYEAEKYLAAVNAFAARAKAAGFTFSYHNHAHEFMKLYKGKTAMEYFLNGFDPDYVYFMPDTYWLQYGGYDVRYFIEQTKGRVKILHLKDMKHTAQGQIFTEIGNGNLYFKGIVKAALDCGIEQFIVEQDICEGDPLESLKQSYGYIKTVLKELK